ncbi:MAG: hypothetical protein AAFR37_25795 [Cyanobacteria bacterium J06628_3]
MSKFKERFLVKMKEWQESDKSSTKLFSTEYDRMLAYLWANSKARKNDIDILSELVPMATLQQYHLMSGNR